MNRSQLFEESRASSPEQCFSLKMLSIIQRLPNRKILETDFIKIVFDLIESRFQPADVLVISIFGLGLFESVKVCTGVSRRAAVF